MIPPRGRFASKLVAASIAAAVATTAAVAGVVCNTFEMKYKVSGKTLELSLDTDLPDNSVLMVSVSRSYREAGTSTRYSHDYFSERSTVGKWRRTQKISIDSDEWTASFRQKQKELSRVGLGFEVASISDKITISMVVPVNQPNPDFGERNADLSGKAVQTSRFGLRVAEKEVEIESPLDPRQAEDKVLPSLEPGALAIGVTYVVSRGTPLMPSHSPSDPLEAIKNMKQVPEDGSFKVLEVYRKDTTPWYRATATGKDGESLGMGWINSTALVGQALEVIKDKPVVIVLKHKETGETIEGTLTKQRVNNLRVFKLTDGHTKFINPDEWESPRSGDRKPKVKGDMP